MLGLSIYRMLVAQQGCLPRNEDYKDKTVVGTFYIHDNYIQTAHSITCQKAVY